MMPYGDIELRLSVCMALMAVTISRDMLLIENKSYFDSNANQVYFSDVQLII